MYSATVDDDDDDDCVCECVCMLCVSVYSFPISTIASVVTSARTSLVQSVSAARESVCLSVCLSVVAAAAKVSDERKGIRLAGEKEAVSKCSLTQRIEWKGKATKSRERDSKSDFPPRQR